MKELSELEGPDRNSVMKDHMAPPPTPQHGIRTDEVDSVVSSQASEPGIIVSNAKSTLHEQALEFVSSRFPEAKDPLKERLAISIQQRQAQIQRWKNHVDQAAALGTESRTSTTSESKHCDRSSELHEITIKPSEATRWKNMNDFPKEPIINDSKSLCLCQICLTSIPPQEATGGPWIQHVAKDLAPYVCVTERCKIPTTAFSSFEEWSSHMKDESGSLLEALTSCPLCLSQTPQPDSMETREKLEDYEVLHQHIAGHLQSLALDSLSFAPVAPRGMNVVHQYASIDANQNQLPPPLLWPIFGQESSQLYSQPLHSSFPPHQIPLGSRPFIPTIPSHIQNVHPTRPPPNPVTWNSTPSQMSILTTSGSQSLGDESFDVLYVEDNLINQKVLTKIVQKFHHRVVLANNGLEGVNAFKKRKFDVVLMDISMPIMDGFEATRKIREYENLLSLPRTPIIGCLASCLLGDVERVIEALMDDCLRKPVMTKRWVNAVVHWGRLGRFAATNNCHQFLASIAGGAETSQRSGKGFGAKL